MKKGKKIMMFFGIVVLVLALWIAFCGYQWSWGPFAGLHSIKTAKLPGNAEPYAPEHSGTVENSPLAGKHIVFLGSSITQGYAAMGTSFADYIALRNACTITKEAVPGTTLADGSPLSYIPRMKRLDTDMKVDLFVCQLSTNDTWKNKALGEISADGKYDTSTVAGAIEFIISYAKDTWGCPVVFYTNPPFEDAKYPEMVALLHEIADIWDITVIDMWSDKSFSAITGEQHALYMADHIHPTRAGYLEWWTPYMEPYLYAALNAQR